MKILVANDDGIDAKGLQTLVKVLARNNEVYVVAPSTQKNAYSQSVTYFFGDKKAWVRNDIEGATKAWAVDGTPADCIYYGIYAFLHDKPDVVISGINHGQNLSTDVLYSGTVGAASEGLIAGIPSIATSLCTYEDYDFTTAALITEKVLYEHMKRKDKLNYVLSINVPALSLSQIKGIKVVGFDGIRDYSNKVTVTKQQDYLVLHHPHKQVGILNSIGMQGDVTCVDNGYVTLTPITIDRTYYSYLNILKGSENINIK